MRKLLQRLLKKPLTWMGNYLAASPKKEVVNKSLTNLFDCIKKKTIQSYQINKHRSA